MQTFSTGNGHARPQDALARYLPLLIGLAATWLFARGLRKAAWTAFAMYWAVHWLK